MNKMKERILDILSGSFDTNNSVNFVVKQDNRRKQRIRKLVNYSFKRTLNFGKAFVSEDGRACMLVVDPNLEKTTLLTIWWDIQLAFSVVGINRVFKVLKREKAVKSEKPSEPYIYLWFVGVDPQFQGQGKGAELIQSLISNEWRAGRSIYLETSNARNFPFYEKLGFECLGKVDDAGYELRQYIYRDHQH